MTSKHASGLYEYYPGAFSHVPDIPNPAPLIDTRSINEQKWGDDIPTAMGKLKECVRQCIANTDTSKYPSGDLLKTTIADIHSILNEVESIEEMIQPPRSALMLPIEPKRSLTAVLEGTMTHFREHLCHVDFASFPTGENLWEAEMIAHQMIDEMESLLKVFRDTRTAIHHEETATVINTAARST